MGKVYERHKDGEDHINVYSKGLTELGRLLSNFAHTPFECEDGRFASIEGYWYWLATDHPDRDRLRDAHGWRAKQLGRELRGEDWPSTPGFQEKVLRALEAKYNAAPRLRELLSQNTLPLAHYYVAANGYCIQVKDGGWILEFWEGKRGY